MRDLSDLYYECHVTIDPVFEEERETLAAIIKPYKFKLAKLVMKKNKGDDYKDSTLDTFFTAHGKYYSDLQQRMVDCVREVQANGYTVRRYKIENTILDSKLNDLLELI